MTNEEQDSTVENLRKWGEKLQNGSGEEAALGAQMVGLAAQLKIRRQKEGSGQFAENSTIYQPLPGRNPPPPHYEPPNRGRG
jgi:hypothetical protein